MNNLFAGLCLCVVVLFAKGACRLDVLERRVLLGGDGGNTVGKARTPSKAHLLKKWSEDQVELETARRGLLHLAYWGAFLFGLALTNQHTMVLFEVCE